MIVCIFGHVQWRWELNDIPAHGYRDRRQQHGLDAAADPVPALEDHLGSGRIVVSEQEGPNM